MIISGDLGLISGDLGVISSDLGVVSGHLAVISLVISLGIWPLRSYNML